MTAHERGRPHAKCLCERSTLGGRADKHVRGSELSVVAGKRLADLVHTAYVLAQNA